jgi:hypothetical protein
MTRTFQAEHKRLRGQLRAAGRDPYRPSTQPWVPAAERLRRQRAPRPRFTLRDLTAAWDKAMRATPPDTWAASAVLRELERAR